MASSPASHGTEPAAVKLESESTKRSKRKALRRTNEGFEKERQVMHTPNTPLTPKKGDFDDLKIEAVIWNHGWKIVN